MRTNSDTILVKPPLRGRSRSNQPGRTCAFCVAAARLFAGAAVALGIVYVPTWVATLAAWYLG